MLRLTREQCDELIRMIGFDGEVDESTGEDLGVVLAQVYFLDDGSAINVKHNGIIYHMAEGGSRVDDIHSEGIGHGNSITRYWVNGKSVGRWNSMLQKTAQTEEERRTRDLQVLARTEAKMKAQGTIS